MTRRIPHFWVWLVFCLGLCGGSASAQGVAMAVDRVGAVEMAAGGKTGPVNALDYLPPDAELRLAAGASATLVYLASTQEWQFTGPGRYRLQAGQPAVLQGAAPKLRGGPAPAGQANAALSATQRERMAMGAVVMRSTGPDAEQPGQPVQPVQAAPARPVPALPGDELPADVFVQTGNSLHTTMVRFSPDGQRVATCDGVGAVVAWDAVSGRQYREVHRHTGMCLGLAFTPDGQNLVSSGGARSGNEVVLSRWTDGAVLQTWEGHNGQVRDVVATLDGQGAWSLGEHDGLRRWAVGADAPKQSLPLLLPGEEAEKAPYIGAMVLTRDQKKAYVTRNDGTVLAVDLSGATPPVLLTRLPEALSAIALSPDGTLLALSRGTIMGSSDQDVLLVNALTGQEVKRLKGHAGNVFALAFSPDGKLLASAAQIDTNTMLTSSFKSISQHESLRLWRVGDGALLADMRNQRNLNGTPFVRGSLAFSPPPPAGSPDAVQRLGLALWDEATRLYEVDASEGLRLVYTLEGRGLSPLQIRASDALGRLLVTDGRPRKAPKDNYLQATQLRSEFGRPADWTPERVKRTDEVYSERGMLSKVQHAALWDVKTGRLERVLDWQRAAPGGLGLDAQGRFVSVAPLFPDTLLIKPLRTFLLREATADAQGDVALSHFGYEPWDGPLTELFTPLGPTVPVAGVLEAGSYRTEVLVQSPTQRFTAVGGIPVETPKAGQPAKLQPRLFVQERLANGERVPRLDLAVPGLVRALAFSGDERTLWVSGTTSGTPYDMAHRAWLQAVNLADGKLLRQWELAEGLTVDLIVAHPSGQMAITNGGTNLSIWDHRQAARRYFVKASNSLRPLRALALSEDGRTIASSDNAGWAAMWDWPGEAEPVPRWGLQLPSPFPHVLTFMAADRRIAAGAADGSVRLMSSADGSEIARMIRFDNDEWITIIPEGYFVASQEGDRWVNVRRDGKVYGIGQFYDVFYRPDIVERRLAGEPIAPLITVTLQDALRQPPPQVTLTLPAALATAAPAAGQKVRLSLQVATQGGGVGEVRVLHNGKLVEVLNRAVLRSGLAAQSPQPPASPPAAINALQAQGAASGEQAVTRALRLAVQAQQDPATQAPPLQQLNSEVEVELVPGENAFSVIGFNGPGNLNARPVTRSVLATGVAPPPRVFVLAVGVDIFMNPNAAPTLQYAVKDSSDFARVLRGKLGSTYRDAPVVVKLLQNEQATRSGLAAALAQLQLEVRANDLLVWFVASHGTLDSSAQYGIVLHDWDGKTSGDSLFSTTNILDASRRIKAFNQLVILDTCHAGGVNSLVRGLYDARLAVLARNMGLHVFASASATEEAIDGYQGNGLFTHTLLEGLNTNLADRNADKQVTVNELGDFARRETMRIARSLRHSQEPLLMNFGKDVTVYATD